MFFKLIKMGTLVAGGALLAGGVIFGNELSSYVHRTRQELRLSVKDHIPVEFEIRRARDLLHGIGPEIHNSVRAIAEQEVETEMLKRDIDDSKLALAEESTRVVKLRDAVASGQSTVSFSGINFSRAQLIQELSRRFNNFKAAQTALNAKEVLLENRQKSLMAAQEALESAKSQQAVLESQIEGLEAQYKLVQATSQSSDSPSSIDHSKLSQAKNAIGEIRKHLAVAERVLAHEAKFTPSLPPEAVDEKDLVNQVDAHFSGGRSAVSASNTTPEPDAH